MAQLLNSTAGEDCPAPPSDAPGVLHGLISFCLESGIHLWVQLTGKLVRKLPKLDQPVSWSSLKVSPDGAHFATVCMTAENLDKPRPVAVWNMASGQKQSEWMPPSVVRAVGWTHDGQLVSVGGTADSLLIWRIQ